MNIHIHIHVNWIKKKIHIQYIYVEFCPTFSKSIPSNPTRSEIRSIDVSSKTKTKTGPSSYPINQQQQCQHYNSHWPPAPACFELEREKLSDGQKRGGQACAPLVVLLPVVLLTLSLLSHGHRGSRQVSTRGTSWQARRATLKRVCKRSWTSPCSPPAERSRGEVRLCLVGEFFWEMVR